MVVCFATSGPLTARRYIALIGMAAVRSGDPWGIFSMSSSFSAISATIVSAMTFHSLKSTSFWSSPPGVTELVCRHPGSLKTEYANISLKG